MTTTTHTTTTTSVGPVDATARSSLRRLYLARSAFAVVWAAVFAAASSPVGTVTVVLLVLYPAFDVVAALVDRRGARHGRAGLLLVLDVAVSALAAVVIGAIGDDVEGILLAWGAWAVLAGLLQLVVATSRRRLGGQLPQMFSGGLSVLAGLGFAASAHAAGSVTNVAGYALLGAVFFLVSALRLGRDGQRGATRGE